MNKKSLSLLLILILSLSLGLTACSKAPAEEDGQPVENLPAEEVQVEESYIFENEEKDFSLEIPTRFELVETELVEDYAQGYIYRFTSGPETFEISDIEFPGVTVDEALIEEEVEMGSGLEITRFDHVEVPSVGTFYGALVHDESLGRYNFYHRINKDDRIISILQSRAVPYSLEEEAQNKAMLGTMKFK